MKASTDASVLIFFAKMNRLDLLMELFSELYVSNVVMNEVLPDGQAHEEIPALKKFIIGSAKIIASRKALGEDSAIEVAKTKKAKIILADDFVAIKKAKFLGITVYSCPFILLLALKRKLVSLEEFNALLDSLLSFNYFISPKALRLVIETSNRLHASEK